MVTRSAADIALLAEKLLIRAANPYISERRSRILEARSDLLVRAAEMAKRREAAATTARAVRIAKSASSEEGA